jgi:hypothetical protein
MIQGCGTGFPPSRIAFGLMNDFMMSAASILLTLTNRCGLDWAVNETSKSFQIRFFLTTIAVVDRYASRPSAALEVPDCNATLASFDRAIEFHVQIPILNR